MLYWEKFDNWNRNYFEQASFFIALLLFFYLLAILRVKGEDILLTILIVHFLDQEFSHILLVFLMGVLLFTKKHTL